MKVISSTYERHADSSGTITTTYEDGSVRYTPLPSLWGSKPSESFVRLGIPEGSPIRPYPGQRAERMNEDQITEADREEQQHGMA
jgi:hypothetical protein